MSINMKYIGFLLLLVVLLTGEWYFGFSQSGDGLHFAQHSFTDIEAGFEEEPQSLNPQDYQIGKGA